MYASVAQQDSSKRLLSVRSGVRIPPEAPYAELLELVDWTDLGSVVERRVGSSPTFSTKTLETRRVHHWALSKSLKINI